MLILESFDYIYFLNSSFPTFVFMDIFRSLVFGNLDDISVSTARKIHAKKKRMILLHDITGIFTNRTPFFTPWLCFIIRLSIWQYPGVNSCWHCINSVCQVLFRNALFNNFQENSLVPQLILGRSSQLHRQLSESMSVYFGTIMAKHSFYRFGT